VGDSRDYLTDPACVANADDRQIRHLSKVHNSAYAAREVGASRSGLCNLPSSRRVRFLLPHWPVFSSDFALRQRHSAVRRRSSYVVPVILAHTVFDVIVNNEINFISREFITLCQGDIN
jgi:hypothetical protein